MQTEASKRKEFLELFLGALGAKQIVWLNQKQTSISGTVVYNPSDPEDRQNFIWHKSENEVPNDRVKTVIKYLIEKELLYGDKLKLAVDQIEIPNIDSEIKEEVFKELFSIQVSMIDQGQETDFYFIHE